MDHWKAGKKVLRYFQGTKHHMLTYRKFDHLVVTGYADSDYAGCVDTRISTFGYIFLLAGESISWKSVKQYLIAASTMEAEFVAFFEAKIQGNWLRNFISELKLVDNISKSLKIYCDNTTTIFFSKNDQYSKGVKHMELKYFSVKEEIQKHKVTIEHISTKLMIDDPLTKYYRPKPLLNMLKKMGLTNSDE